MWKPLLVLAIAANLFFITPSEGSSSVSTSSSSSTSSSTSTSSSSSSSTSTSSSSTSSSSSHTSGSSGGGTGGCTPKPTKPPPTCAPKCPENEEYHPCPVTCPPRECGVNPALILCAADPECHPGCQCKRGYLRNYDGVCVPKDKCPKCPKNEVYDECPAPCPPQRCDVDPRLIRCAAPPKPGDPDCEPGCRCRDGWVRNDDGICIPRDQCPKCPPNEVYDVCPAPCPPRRCDVDDRVISCAPGPKPGDPECQPGCRCADGYARNNEGVCVPRDQCPKCTRPHEIWDPCPPNCPPQTCESIYARYNCPEQPVPGSDNCEGACRCEPGYLRNKIGECISIENCQKCPGPHEYFSCGVACDNVCATLSEQNQTSCPIINIVCNPMCYCEADYARDDNNICIPIDECPDTQCGEHEIYSDCPPYACRPLQCSEVGFPVRCPATDGICPGKPGCICDYGYVRNEYGVCIPIGDCPSCGGDPNAVSGCGVNCGRHCSDYNKKDVACILVCYENACDCRDGYVYDDNTKKCVLPENCTPVCGVNEVYSNCSNGGCGPKTCSQLGFKIGCVKMDLKYCREGCICREGYLRDDKGKCIPKEQCPACGGDPNAVAGCGVNCGRLCSNYDKGPVGCAAVCYEDGCDCRKGYVLDTNTGKCVRPKDCTPQCGKNEKYEQCPDTLCIPQNCSQLGFPWPAVPCPTPGDGPCPGPPGCVCIDDYVRDDKGVCIPKKECPSCGGDPNAVSGCGVNCGRLCSNYNQGPVPCPRICYPNACDCRDGFVLDENIRKCVLPEDCTPTCGVNEVYDSCANGGCRKRRCSQPVICVRPIKCEGGCICQEGYTRNDNGECIPIDQCPDQCNKPHEYYNECAPTCPPQTCDSIGKEYDCPIQPAVCRGACVCDDGYYRNSQGYCITAEECKKCTGPHEYFACGGACDNVCATINKQNQTNCPIVNIICNSMCYCEKDYARDANNICIPIEECPPPQCPDDERYEQCPANLCEPTSCSQLGFPLNCSDPSDPCPGGPGCVCDYGNVRDDKGKCIPRDQCPSCGGDPNAVSGCGGNCDRRCSNYQEKNVVCPLICMLNGCDCRDGYVYDDNIGKCVLPEDCTPTCGINEEYSTCANGGCRKWSCSTPGILCIDPIKCIGGCTCKQGHSRADNGTCIPEDQCPVPLCGPNEIYDECPDICSPQTCDQLGFPIACPPIDCPSPPACVCEYGYVRDANGICIPKKECPSCGGDPNAESGCGLNCGRLCSNYDKGPVPCPKICKFNACDCKKGYVYDENTKKCVLPKNCTPTCGQDEVYSECINGGCQRKNCSQIGKPVLCVKIDPAFCIKGCLCKENYLRAANGTCVPEDQCPGVPPCGPNEIYDECPDICSPQRCDQLGFPIACPPIDCPSPPACVCEYGYVRDANGICIPKKECPSCGGDPNAESGCGLNCGRLCSNYDKGPVPCPKICKFNACDCKKGYVFDENTKKCVLPKNCTPTCGQDEIYSECINGGCLRKNCSQIGKPVPCVKIDPAFCIKGCLCKENYLRAANGTCVPEDQCPEAQCNKPNEYYDECAPTCPPQTCESIGKKYHCPKQPPDNCKGACRCKKGYYRNKNGDCVTEQECKANCPDGQRYVECPPALCYPLTCAEVGFPVPCPDLPPDGKCPVPGACVCNDSYVKDANGKCIPMHECPSCGGDPNAVSGCGGYCGNRCSDYKDKNVTCPLICYFNACDCRKGYVYDDKQSKCVRPKDCSPTCGINEEYSTCANGGCRKWNCSTPGILCIDPIKCIGGCTCKQGHSRADNGTCIPEDQCPVPPCGPNEIYDECPDICSPQTCDQLGFPIACPPIDCPSPPACVCEYGYVRDANGICIPKKECPSCGGDPNAESGCGLNCGRLCSNYDKGPVPCPKICKFNACDCKKGYVFDENTKKCVLPKNCTPTCGQDEVYSECINGGCQRKNCSQIGKPVLCVKIDPAFCIKGCLCKENYLRAANGTCVPEDQCPGVPPCGPNEVYDECPDICSPQRCDQLGFPIACPPIDCPSPPACVCEYGYVRDANGICIPKKECPSCGGDPNAESGCGLNCGRLCSNYDKGPVPCPKICKFNACDCKKGYVFDENTKKCVLPKNCTPTCGQDEIYSECINGGCQRKNCSQIGKPVPCVKIDPAFCIKGCLCKENYLRAANGTCVPEDQCPEARCNKPNEYYDECAPTCPPQTCESIGKKYHCPKQPPDNCKGACRCKKGYYRNKNGDCVTEQECKANCPDGQRYVECPPALCYPLTCAEVGFPVPCPDLPPDGKCPVPGACVCNDSYVKDANGKCIPMHECPSCGGDPNAVSGCGDYCGNRCSDYKDKNVTCPLICYFNACDCRKGYVYDDKQSKCVRPKDCYPTCGKNEVYDSCANGGCNKRNCSQLGEPTLCIDPIECEGGCVCQQGYLRAKNGTCIPETQCPDPCRRPHEYYDPCPPICPPQTCDSLGRAYACPAIPDGGIGYCNGACRCEEGYYRNKIGECISERDCLTCTGPNEYFSCGSACDNVCATIKKQNQTHCPIINKKCNPKCYCEKGYARDANNICIPIEQCKGSCKGDPNAVPGCGTNCGKHCYDYKNGPIGFCPEICSIHGCDCKENYYYDDNIGKCVLPKDCTPTCEENEVFDNCINGGCQKKNCSQIGQPDVCVRPQICIKGCLCRDGYLRHDNGTCVPIDQCQETCTGDPNAEPGCGINCGRRCSNYNKPPPQCALGCIQHGCDCKPDYVFDDNIGRCVLPKDCTPVCGSNEVYDACSNGGCDIRKCSELANPIYCEDPEECIGDCVCKQGFLRDEDGVCVPIRECKPPCGPHEVYDPCPSDCSPGTCESIGKAYSCPANPYQNCEGACVCETGYFRNKIGECISKKDCLKCTGPHEYFSCGGACDNVCATLSKQNQTNCPIINSKCNPRCYCEEGYARDSNNTCIAIEDCPGPRCGPNERYERRPSTICDPMYCSELGFPIDCSTSNCDCQCNEKPACVCKNGYVRDYNNVCVPVSECPSCGGDPNAEAGCGVNCGRTCSTYGKNVSCITVCYPNACDCRDGFVYDEVIKKCVKYEDCTEPGDGGDGGETGATTPPSLNDTEIQARLNRGTISLSSEFIYQLSQSKPDENFVVSATSLLTPLAQISIFARGLVLEELLSLQNLNSIAEVRDVYPGLIDSYKNQKEVEFEVANKYFFNENYQLSDEFQEISASDFDAAGENVDFGEPEQAADIINNYVYNKTRGRIQDLVSPDALNAYTIVVLVNAIYFLGNWVHQFNPNSTEKRDFYKRDGSVIQLDTMYQENTFNYAEDKDLGIQALEMPYKNGNFSLLVILPENGRFDNTVQALRNPSVFENIVGSLSPQKVIVYLPKMLINTNLDIKEMLIKANKTEMFNPDADGFYGVLEDDKPLYISAIVQKTFFKCDETGTEAAAATAIIGATTTSVEVDPPPVYLFDANRSYLIYLLFDKSPMFSGAFVGGP